VSELLGVRPSMLQGLATSTGLPLHACDRKCDCMSDAERVEVSLHESHNVHSKRIYVCVRDACKLSLRVDMLN
jgi:hypothetical protein